MMCRSPRAISLGTILAASAVLLAACGQEDEEARAQPKAPQLASAQLIGADPYAIACGHVRDQQQWADVTRRATVAIADRERIPKLNRLQATQSLFYAMTVVCKGRPRSFEPAGTAVRAVRAGTYRADLAAP
jgi:uncharacterized lipoprotein YajG